MNSNHRAAPARGFTLVEMMSVVAVTAILMAIAAPGMSQMLESQRLRSLAFDLISDLTLARSESLKRGARVTVVPSINYDWKSGWRILVDSSGEVVRQRPAASGLLTISGAPASVSYDRSGRLTGSDGVIRIELDSAALAHDSHGRCISIDPLGRARSDIGACG